MVSSWGTVALYTMRSLLHFVYRLAVSVRINNWVRSGSWYQGHPTASIIGLMLLHADPSHDRQILVTQQWDPMQRGTKADTHQPDKLWGRGVDKRKSERLPLISVQRQLNSLSRIKQERHKASRTLATESIAHDPRDSGFGIVGIRAMGVGGCSPHSFEKFKAKRLWIGQKHLG